jgi:DNA (cytosine-5)-methyltransferase 1
VCGSLTTAFDAKNYGNLQEVHSGSVVAVSENQRGELRTTDYAQQLTTGGGKPGQGYPAVLTDLTVRRLTPTECERLMGWPDDWTAHRADGTPIADGPRYRMCGNGVVSNVSEWIGRRVLAAWMPEGGVR